ncbi:ATP-dependent DNA helicase [Perilla frutescens var. hirtella]|uniref:ATP-dependent DNA helicase n=1 Tax=Perilla frutescens var. hirtella TaxID=608512 RepID=A0AAD4J3F0_PERFH|nr:ATP-dependent DNA helicase [Perilla frutescens var. hirtella]
MSRAAAGDDHNLCPRPITDMNVGSQLHHHQPMSEKLKASNFPINTISIGPWKRVSRHEGELTAKLYFAKRKLVWEFLDGQLKSKIEVVWSDITAIKALMPPHQPGSLQIELGKPPLFFREIKPQPRKHTNWQEAGDFTQGHALLYRTHYATFPPGVLDTHYHKLLQCDQHLSQLIGNFPHMVPVENPHHHHHHHHPIGMNNMNYFHEEASFLDSSADLQQPLILPPPHDHHQSPAAGSFLSVDDIINPHEFNHIQILHDNLTVPNYNSYADHNPPPTTLEGSNNCIHLLDADTKPNLDDFDDHINNFAAYNGNLYHHPQY